MVSRAGNFLPLLSRFLDSVLSLLLFYPAVCHSVQNKFSWLT